MCILIVKPKDKLCPSKEILEECFYRNPDGAGFSYNKNGVIVLRKGFMTFNEFYEATKKIPTSSTAIIHCRIGTSGGNTEGLTHPYPLCNDYKKMQKTSQIIKPTENKKAYAVAHNGIFTELEKSDKVNDTCIFIANILNPLNDIADDILDERLDSVISRCVDDSRIAILDNDGRCKMYGSGWIQDCGIYYSNSSYKPFISTFKSGYGCGYNYSFKDYDKDVIYDEDAYYEFDENLCDYVKKPYDTKFISDKIKKYGSWTNYLNYISQVEEDELEDLKLEYPEFAEDIDYYATQGMTAFQIRQFADECFFEENDYITKSSKSKKDYPEEDDYYEDESGIYKMEIKDGTNDIILKKIHEDKKDTNK